MEKEYKDLRTQVANGADQNKEVRTRIYLRIRALRCYVFSSLFY